MVIIPLLFGVLLMQAGSLNAVAPSYPAQAFQGGTVVVQLVLSDGKVTRARALSGDEPFVRPTLNALRQWRFAKDRGNGAALVIVNFRSPNLYATGSRTQELEIKRESIALPLPKAVVEPAYPPNSMGQGGVILQCKVNESGRIFDVKALQGLGDLTVPCTDAVREWKLDPARDAAGNPAASEIYCVCVFRQPVLQVPK